MKEVRRPRIVLMLGQRKMISYTFIKQHETLEIISVPKMTEKSKAANKTAPELMACHQCSVHHALQLTAVPLAAERVISAPRCLQHALPLLYWAVRDSSRESISSQNI